MEEQKKRPVRALFEAGGNHLIDLYTLFPLTPICSGYPTHQIQRYDIGKLKFGNCADWVSVETRNQSNYKYVRNVHALAVTAHPVGGKERPLLVLQTYCDESHDEKSERVYVMAGFLGVESEWTIFTRRWAKALKDAGLSAFHMSECVGGHGEFKDMSWDKREELQRIFIGIITGTHILGAPGAILLSPYNALKPRIKKARTIAPGRNVSGSLEDPYFLAFQLAVELIAKNANSHGTPANEQIAFVFDRTHLKGRAGPLYYSILDSTTLDYVDRLGPLTFADKRSFLPLQAADILAYEHFRHIDDCMLRGEPERWQWIEVMKKVPEWHLFDEASLEKLLEQQGW